MLNFLIIGITLLS